MNVAPSAGTQYRFIGTQQTPNGQSTTAREKAKCEQIEFMELRRCASYLRHSLDGCKAGKRRKTVRISVEEGNLDRVFVDKNDDGRDL